MKKIFFIISCLCLIAISLSVVYYFVIFLPQQQRANNAVLKNIEQSTINTEENTQNMQPATNTNNVQDQLDSINNTLQQQQQDADSRTRCEANGGKYLGNGSCCLTNCANVN